MVVAEPEPTPVGAAQAVITAAAGGGVATLTKTALEAGATTDIVSLLEGEAVPLSEVPDPIFAGEKLGKGVPSLLKSSPQPLMI